MADQDSSQNELTVEQEASSSPSRPRPVYVSFPERSSSQHEEYEEQLKADLAEDKIPDIMRESGRLVAEGDSADGDAVIAYVRTVLDKLSMARTGKPAPELRIFLSDQQGINTGVVTAAKTPILIVGLGTLDKLHEFGFAEDHLASVLGHERFHLLRHEKWADMENGRPEETIADVFGVKDAADAGYNPKALGQFFGKLLDEEKQRKGYRRGNGFGSVLSGLMDEHPKTEDRIRNTDVAVAALQQQKRLTEEPTPIPGSIIEAAARAKYLSPWDQYKKDHGYDVATPAEKVEIIGGYLDIELQQRDGVDKWRPNQAIPDLWLMSHRLGAVYDDILSLAGQEGVAEASRKQLYAFSGKFYGGEDIADPYFWVLEKFVNLQSPEENFRAAYFRDRGEFEIYRNRPIGFAENVPEDFLRLRTASTAFWAATTKEEALAAAELYNESEGELAPYMTGIMAMELLPEQLRWPERKEIRQQIAAKGYAQLPWEKHYQWIKSFEGEDRQLLEYAAVRMGFPDERLTGRQKAQWQKDFNDGFDLSDTTMDEKGHITALVWSERERQKERRERFENKTGAELFRSEYKRSRAVEKEEEELVRTTDWSGMESDFWGFIEQNVEALMPDVGVIARKFPFAEEFMTRLQALHAATPEKWQEDYIAFMTGEHPDGRNKGRYGEVELQAYSLPDLIARTEKAYFSSYAKGFDYKAYRPFKGKRGKLQAGHPLAERLASLHDQRKDKDVFYHEEKRDRYVTYTRKPLPVPAEREQVEIAIGGDTNHPYVGALLGLDKKYLKPGKKGALLSHFDGEDAEAASLESYYKISPRKVFNYAACPTAHSINKLEERVTGDNNDQHHYILGYLQEVEILRSLRSLDSAKKDQRFAVSELSPYKVFPGFHFINDPALRQKLVSETEELINRQLERNRRVDFAPEVSLQTLVTRFVNDHGYKGDDYDRKRNNHNIFATRPDLEKLYLEHIKERIMKLPLAQRVSPLEQVMTLQLQDPAYRDWAINHWVDAVTALSGKDGGDPAYAKKMLRRIKNVVSHIDTSQGIGCITALLEKTEAQREVALGAKEILIDVYGQQYLEKDTQMRLMEEAIETCSTRPELRQAFLEYVTRPVSTGSTNTFIRALKKTCAGGNYAPAFVKNFFDPKNHIIMSKEQEHMVVDSLHANLWAMPFELRTVYLDRILFPVGEGSKEAFDKAVNFVLDKVLPPQRRFSEEAREALTVYLDNCPEELRRVTFSAILATTRKVKGEKSLRVGQVLSQTLSRTGAAGGQLLQAAHSYLSGLDIKDPDLIQLRDDLKSSKVDFQRPKRWEVFERLDQALPEQARQTIERIGPLLGCGSTAYVVAKEGTDGEESAIKLMRKDVMPIADLQFERYGLAFDELSTRRKFYAALPDLVNHARDLIRASAQGTVAAEQITYAQDSYDSVAITVDGEKFGFEVAPVLSYGPEYLETKLVSGKHLNDMKASDSAKKNLSIAAETIEIYRLLQGRAIDQDRHGYQQRVQGNTIGIFDVGALPYNVEQDEVAVPTAEDKNALGRLLGLTFNAAFTGKSPIDEIVNAVTKMEWGSAKNYLVGIQKGLLARADIHAGFGATPEEKADVLTAIFGTVLKVGYVDPAIFKGLCETATPSTFYRMGSMAVKGKLSAVNIAIDDAGISAATPKLTPSKAISVVAKTGLRRTFNRVAFGVGLDRVHVLPFAKALNFQARA